MRTRLSLTFENDLYKLLKSRKRNLSRYVENLVVKDILKKQSNAINEVRLFDSAHAHVISMSCPKKQYINLY